MKWANKWSQFANRSELYLQLSLRFQICALQSFHICKAVLRADAGDAYHHGNHFSYWLNNPKNGHNQIIITSSQQPQRFSHFHVTLTSSLPYIRTQAKLYIHPVHSFNCWCMGQYIMCCLCFLITDNLCFLTQIVSTTIKNCSVLFSSTNRSLTRKIWKQTFTLPSVLCRNIFSEIFLYSWFSLKICNIISCLPETCAVHWIVNQAWTKKMPHFLHLILSSHT